MYVRSNNQESRGRIQRMRSGSTPASSSHVQVSIAVLPAPMTVTSDTGRSRSTRSFGGIMRTPAPTSNSGRWRDGIDDST